MFSNNLSMYTNTTWLIGLSIITRWFNLLVVVVFFFFSTDVKTTIYSTYDLRLLFFITNFSLLLRDNKCVWNTYTARERHKFPRDSLICTANAEKSPVYSHFSPLPATTPINREKGSDAARFWSIDPLHHIGDLHIWSIQLECTARTALVRGRRHFVWTKGLRPFSALPLPTTCVPVRLVAENTWYRSVVAMYNLPPVHIIVRS